MSMEITRVKVTFVDTSFWGAFSDRQDELEFSHPMAMYPQSRHPVSSWFPDVRMCVVEIETANGLVGTGWCEDYSGASSIIVERHLTRFLIGADARNRGQLWDQMYRSTIPYGRKGPAIFAISAVDIALWDLVGKHLGQPVHQLLGGKSRDSVQIYASALHFTNEDDFVREASDYVSRGFKAMKMRFQHGPADGREGLKRNVEIVKLLRETVGDNIDIMGDAYMAWDLEYALRMCRALAPFDMKWVEEPLLPDQIRDYVALRKESPVPIAAGEHESTRYGFTQLIESEALDIIQFDIGRVGGFSEGRRVCTLAQAAGLPVFTHAYGLPALQLATNETTIGMVEYFPVPVWEGVDEAPHYDGAPTPLKGEVALGDEPGLGATLTLPGFTPLG